MSGSTVATDTIGRQRRIRFEHEAKPNPIGVGTLDELEAAIAAVEADDDVAVVSFAGAGGAFATGADLSELADWWEEGRWDRLVEFVHRGQQVVDRIDGLVVPTIAAIDGYALGGGLEVALACDFRFASGEAQLGTPEVELGMLPAWGGTQRLPALVGESTALDLLLSGRRVEAAEAESLGLVDRVVDDDELLAVVDDYAADLAEKPAETVAHILDAVRAGRSRPTQGGLAVELRNDVLSIFTDEAQARTRAFLDG
ncbi:MAG: enoyl-CoA hydratase/isomerase family protein [Halobacteriales archaeon]